MITLRAKTEPRFCRVLLTPATQMHRTKPRDLPGRGVTFGPHTPANELIVVFGGQGFGKGSRYWNRLHLYGNRETGRQVCARSACSHVCRCVHDACASIDERTQCRACLDVRVTGCPRGCSVYALLCHVCPIFNRHSEGACHVPRAGDSWRDSLVGFAPIRGNTRKGSLREVLYGGDGARR